MTALAERVRRRLVSGGLEGAEPTSARVTQALREEGIVLGDAAVLSLVTELCAELAGVGPLQPLLEDPAVTDVLVNGPQEVWIDRGDGLALAPVVFREEADVRLLAQRLAALAGRRLDEASPYVDARLPDGSRLHAVIPPIASGGTALSLRIPRRRAFTLEELQQLRTLCELGAQTLLGIIRARLTFLITGGTGCGKTTVLATMLACVAPEERMVIVEDSAELRPEHPHVVRLEARPANLEGAGAITTRDLVRQALRMRPDRLIVGEVRGAEVVDMLSAFNTGHQGGCGTVHANSAQELPARLEALGLAAGLPRDAIHSLARAGIDAVLHLERDRHGVRRLAEVHVAAEGTRELELEPALVRVGDEMVPSAGFARLSDRMCK